MSNKDIHNPTTISSGSAVTATAASYDGLPASSSDGTRADVTATSESGVYSYVGDLEGVPLNGWVPADWVVKGMTWLTSSSGPIRYDGPDGDTKASITTDSTFAFSTSGGTVVDGVNSLIFNCPISSQNARMSVTMDAIAADQKIAFILEVDHVDIPPEANNNQGFLFINNGLKQIGITTVADNVKNSVAWSRYNTAASVGAGRARPSNGSFARIFGTIDAGTIGTADNGGGCRLWLANGDNSVSISSADEFVSTASRSIDFRVVTATVTGPTTLELRRLLMFKLG